MVNVFDRDNNAYTQELIFSETLKSIQQYDCVSVCINRVIHLVVQLRVEFTVYGTDISTSRRNPFRKQPSTHRT